MQELERHLFMDAFARQVKQPNLKYPKEGALKFGLSLICDTRRAGFLSVSALLMPQINYAQSLDRPLEHATTVE